MSQDAVAACTSNSAGNAELPWDAKADHNSSDWDWIRHTCHTDRNRLVDDLIFHRTGLIIGPHGTGKTTLVQSLLPVLRQRFKRVVLVQLTGCDSRRIRARLRHLRAVKKDLSHAKRLLSSVSGTHSVNSVNNDRLCERGSGSGGLLVVDGAEQIWPGQRSSLRRWSRKGGHAVLATSHFPCSGMHVLYQTNIHAHLIHELTTRLLDDAAPEIKRMVIEELQNRNLDQVKNLRDFWFELFDLVQARLLNQPVC